MKIKRWHPERRVLSVYFKKHLYPSKVHISISSSSDMKATTKFRFLDSWLGLMDDAMSDPSWTTGKTNVICGRLENMHHQGDRLQEIWSPESKTNSALYRWRKEAEWIYDCWRASCIRCFSKIVGHGPNTRGASNRVTWRGPNVGWRIDTRLQRQRICHR